MIRYFLSLFRAEGHHFEFERMKWNGEIVPCSPFRFQMTRSRNKRLTEIDRMRMAA